MTLAKSNLLQIIFHLLEWFWGFVYPEWSWTILLSQKKRLFLRQVVGRAFCWRHYCSWAAQSRNVDRTSIPSQLSLGFSRRLASCTKAVAVGPSSRTGTTWHGRVPTVAQTSCYHSSTGVVLSMRSINANQNLKLSKKHVPRRPLLLAGLLWCDPCAHFLNVFIAILHVSWSFPAIRYGGTQEVKGSTNRSGRFWKPPTPSTASKATAARAATAPQGAGAWSQPSWRPPGAKVLPFSLGRKGWDVKKRNERSD